MKTFKLISLIIISALFAFVACNNDDETASAPVISDVELGTNNSLTGYVGSDLHVEATVVAMAKIDYITILIHQEDEDEDKKSASLINDEDAEIWEFDSTYTEFNGLKNTTFHKHIDIPSDIAAGDYHFHFTVTDLDGNQTLIEQAIEIKYPEDSIAPEIAIASVPDSTLTFASGETISISGIITDDQALGGLYVGLVSEDQLLEDADANDENTITLLHVHDFDDPTEYSFNASLTIGAEQDNNITPKDISWASGNYYLLVKCKDAYAGNWKYSAHYPVIINVNK